MKSLDKIIICVGQLGIYIHQGCGNTMPDLSDLVLFHLGQVENFYLLVLGQVQMYEVNTIL